MTDLRIAQFWKSIEEQPYAFDLYQALRFLDATHPDSPKLGRAPRPQMEPVRVGQEPSVTFAPATLARVMPARDGAPPRIRTFSFGLFGPNGPMPTPITEYVYERERHHGDKTLSSFADLFHHRFGLLFYRAWADAQSTVSLDKPDEDAFSRYVASLQGYGLPAQLERDSVPDHARWFNSGHLVRQTRNAEGLAQILSGFFKTAAQIVEYTGKWLRLSEDQLTRLGIAGTRGQLGAGAVAGQAVWDRQHHFTVRLGPMVFKDYEAMLPGGERFLQLRDWVRTYVGIEFAWDANLVLRRDEVPTTRLGGSQRLGWTCWIGKRNSVEDAADLVIDVERLAAREPVAT